MNQSANFTEYESWNTDMDSSGGGLDHSADSNLSSSDNDRINSSPDNLLKGPSGVNSGGVGVVGSAATGNKFNYVSIQSFVTEIIIKLFNFCFVFHFIDGP